jgi:hypothetical protein
MSAFQTPVVPSVTTSGGDVREDVAGIPRRRGFSDLRVPSPPLAAESLAFLMVSKVNNPENAEHFSVVPGQRRYSSCPIFTKYMSVSSS